MKQLLAIIFATGLLLPTTTTLAQKKKGPVPVGVAQVQALSPETKIELPGTVIPWATTRLPAEIDGRVESLLVREGQFVKKETPLLQMRTVPLELELELAQAESKQALTLLEELQTGTRKEVVEAARFDQRQAKARFKLAESELGRFKDLYDEGVISLDEFERKQSEADAARAAFNGKSELLKEHIAGPRIERIQQAQAQLQGAQARIKIIEDNIERATLKAPFNGYVVKKETEVGEWLEKGDPALTLTAAYPVKVEIDLPQFHYNKVKVGDTAHVYLENGVSSLTRKKYKGKVIEMVTSADPGSRTFPVRIRINTSGSKMAHGMLVRVELSPNSKPQNSLYVPKDALVRSPKETVVWLIRPSDNEKKVRKVLVTPGKSSHHLIAVSFQKKQIKAGDWVVTKGNERLKTNATVRIVDGQ